ncbi:MAG: hypothetical protein WCO22_09060 [Betaproteobacteria bacterium]
MRKLYIVGTGGFAKEVAQLASEINSASSRWGAIEYLCETAEEIGKPMPYGKVVGTDAVLNELAEPADVAVGIGQPRIRRKLGSRILENPLLGLPNLIHPANGIDLEHVLLGRGNIITRGSAFTCDISIGDLNVFNLNSTVGHDAKVGSFNVVNPGCNISGGVSISDSCLLGTGCQVLEGVSIASKSTVGAGAVVVKDIEEEGLTYVGIPARRLDT